MGQEVEDREFSREDRTRYRAKVRRCLDALAHMLSEFDFAVERPMAGIEIEFNLTDEQGRPALKNIEALAAIEHEDFQTELGQYNVEINVAPGHLGGRGLHRFESSIRARLNEADGRASTVGAQLMTIGILPSLEPQHMSGDVISPNPRYKLLSEQILAARGEDIEIVIAGVERFETRTDTILPEAACTSMQLHMQSEPDAFAGLWNASQAIAGVQLALGANSPIFLGRRLWQETRIALFEQATDTRSEELKAQGVRPRVWFGERWITSVFDLFEENVRYFPSLLPVLDDEDPMEMLRRGSAPRLAELTLHNGTVYRWNRPIYDVVDGTAHLRVENRVLPAGPTVVDMMANAAFYFGLTARLAASDRPVWSQLPFGAAEDNFHEAARFGIDAQQYWPSTGSVPARELVSGTLLRLAHEGLDSFGVDPIDRDRLLGVIEGRCRTGRNGALWITEQFEADVAREPDRREAILATTRRYRELMHTNEPVHSWPVG